MYGIRVLFNRVASFRLRNYSKNTSNKKLLEFLAEMPKAQPTKLEARHHRQNIDKKSDKYSPSTVYLQVIGSGTRGAPNTLYLFTDHKRYLFNCGECTQRLAHEHKVKLSKLDHIFITAKTWRNIGGLPGLSLTLQDVGVPNITLHGPEGLDELYNATKRFVIMKDMNVTMANCTSADDFEDNAMRVKYVLLGPHDSLLAKDLKSASKKPKLETPDKEFEEFIHDDTDYYTRGKPDKTKIKPEISKAKAKSAAVTDPQKKKTDKVLHDLQKKSHCTVAYICTLKKRMGSLDLAKCVELGVKPGPQLGQLKNGLDVVLPDGTLVLSRDVKTPDDPGPVFIVMEVPDLTYLKEAEFSAHFDNGENPPENVPALIVHYTPPNVFNHATYREFMAMFGPNTRHIVLNSQNKCLGSEAVHRTQHKLHLLDSEIFPMLRDASVPAVWNSHPVPTNDSPVRRGLEELKNKIALAQFQNIINLEGSKGDGQVCKEEDGTKLEVISGRTLTMFHLRPKRQLDRSAEPKLHVQNYLQEAMDVDGFVTSLEQFKRLIDNVRYAKSDSHKEFPKVVFLGTGSCIPSKTRNTSAIVLQIDENRSMLMDCGEGTFGQLVRFYGAKKVNAFLRTLKAIYISHLHADHHIGLIGVLQARQEAFESAGLTIEPVSLLAPGQIYTWLSMYDAQFEKIKPDFTLIPNQSLLTDASPDTDMTSAVLANIGVQQIQTCLVAHCPNAFGVAIQLDDAHKITYSGDTLPCEALVALGENSTLLIHEATMEDELVDEARAKMHSTTSQAIDIGRQMHARYTVLTHFSQRYARLPRLNPHILNDNKSVGIAFDNMQITIDDLELLPHMYAPLQLMFAEHCVEMELKAANRARQKERQERNSAPLQTDKQHPCSSGIGSPIRSGRGVESPACRSASSAPAAKYRESHSSRLRQELKGMAITGIVRQGPRSQSLSPVQRSPNSSPTRSQAIDTTTPRLPSRRDSEKTIDLNSTPRTSETSNTSRDADKCKFSSSAPCGHVVNTNSKTLNTVPPALTSREANAPRKNGVLAPNLCVRSDVASGYGKPLVTPTKKKLTIRRDFPLNEPATTNGKSPKLCRAKSPAKSWRVENRGPTPAKVTDSVRPTNRLLTYPKVGVIVSMLIHIIGSRMAHVFSLIFFKASPCAVAIIVLGVLFWTATRQASSANSLRASSTSPKVRRDWTPNDVPAAKRKRPLSSSIHTRSRIDETKLEIKPPAFAQNTPITKTKLPKSDTKDTSDPRPNKIQTSLRNPSTEKLKHQFCRDVPIYATGRPNSTIHSNRSFKPQLEDIKSSYLLLSKKIPSRKSSKTQPLNDEKIPVPVPKPKALDENERKLILVKVKEKFQSRRFQADSIYDKIEGLNWISWK